MKEDNYKINFPRFIPNKPCGIDKFEGKSQERLTNAIANHIVTNDSEQSSNNLSRIIGLEGGWGVGKSNVIKQLKAHNDIKSNYYVFEYDAWGHQEDLQRRSFLETLTRELLNEEIVDKSWSKKLEELLSHKITRINRSLPKFDAGALWTAIALSLTPVTTFIAERLENADKVENLYYLIVIAFAPILTGLITWLILMIFKKEMRSFGWLFQISKNENITTENTETINHKEPTVYDFKEWMHGISEKPNKKIIIVYDNMDRLPAEKVKELWSSIHTFFSESNFKNIWTIIPYDEKHLSCAFGEKDEKGYDTNRILLTKYFISKTFPIIYRVTPPVFTDFRDVFNQLFIDAFGNTETTHQEEINRIFRLEKSDATVREIIEFINQIVALKNIWVNEIDILYIAIFTLKKDNILNNLTQENETNTNIASKILSGSYLGESLIKIVTNDEILQKNISALVYGVDLDKAAQIPMSKYIEGCFKFEADSDLNKYADSKSFVPLLSDIIHNIDIVLIDNVIKSLTQLNTEILLDDDHNKIITLWDKLANLKMSTSFDKQEVTPIYEELIIKCSENVKIKVLKHLCNRIQYFDKENFNGKKYFEAIRQIEAVLEIIDSSFNLFDELEDKEVNPNVFIEYVLNAKDKFLLYKLDTNQVELDTYLTTLSPDDNLWKQLKLIESQKVLIDYTHLDLKYLIDLLYANQYRFEIFLKQIEEQIPKATASNFKQYLDVSKIMSVEKPLKIQIDATQRQSIWSTVSQNTNTPEWLEIITIQLANGTNVNVKLTDDQIIYIAKNIDNYANYGDLIVNNTSWSIPLLSKVLKYMTDKKLGVNLSLEKVLPKFIAIVNNLGVSESDLIEQLNRWEKSKDIITPTNIQSLIPDPQFIIFSVATKNSLSDYLNNRMVEAISQIQHDEIYTSIQQTNNYWLIVIQYLIETDFLKLLPDNLITAGNRFLNDIAANKMIVPNPNSIQFKIIEKIEKRKTIETITNIRNHFCNNEPDYKIDVNKFKYFHNWFEKQGELKTRSGDVCQYILSPVIHDDECINILLQNEGLYIEIIKLAQEQADTTKEIIKTKIQNSQDENLITFAKKIGIQQEQKTKNE